MTVVGWVWCWCHDCKDCRCDEPCPCGYDTNTFHYDAAFGEELRRLVDEKQRLQRERR